MEITEVEIKRAIVTQRLKTGKATGVCGIQGEVLEARGETVVQCIWLHVLFNIVWETGKAPED